MPLETESCNQNCVFRENECESTIFKSREEMNRSLSRFCNGNLYVIGNIWVRAVKSVLVGSKMCLVPTVLAAPPPSSGPPPKPKNIRYKELPLYEGPHYEYSKHQEFKDRCKEHSVRLLHSQLLPIVKYYRQWSQQSICETMVFFKDLVVDMAIGFEIRKKKFKAYMRDPEKLHYRRAVFAASTTFGYYYGIKKNGLLTRAFFWASVGALASGFLCFPKETDATFRDITFRAAQVAIRIFNLWCGQAVVIKYGPCVREKPKMPPKRTVDKKYECPEIKPAK